MEGTPVDARKLVEEIWREAEAETEREPPVDLETAALPPADHILHRSELAELNRRWILEPAGGPPARGPLAPIRRVVRALARRAVLSVLSGYLADEREFLVNLVRFENELARRNDELAEEIRLVARSVHGIAERFQREIVRLRDRQERLHRLLEARVERLEERRETP